MSIIIFITLLFVLSLGVTIFIIASKLQHQVNTLEWIIIWVAPLLIGWATFFLSTKNKEKDWEYWGSTCMWVEYEEYYKDWETETYSCNCTTKDGSTSCETCTRMVCNGHGPYYWAYNEFGVKVDLTENQYKAIAKKFGTEYKTDKTNGSCGTGYVWKAVWNKNMDTHQCFFQKKAYVNKVRFNRVLNPFYSKSRIKMLDPYDYPNVNGIDQNHVVGDFINSSIRELSEADRILSEHAAIYGPKPRDEHGQIKPFLFGYLDEPSDMALAQRAYLEGGNKNEFIVLINYDGLTKEISWYDIITYSIEDGALSHEMKMFLESNRGATADVIATKMVEILKEHWIRRHFTQMNEVIKTPVPIYAWVLGLILYAISIGALVIWAISNNF